VTARGLASASTKVVGNHKQQLNSKKSYDDKRNVVNGIDNSDAIAQARTSMMLMINELLMGRTIKICGTIYRCLLRHVGSQSDSSLIGRHMLAPEANF
jgi:hypothetical protein